MRALFFGTPEIAVPSLLALTEVAEVVGVVCQPDRPFGRGLRVAAPAVKQAALRLGLEVFQPLRVKDGDLLHWMRQRQADVGVVIAYGRILPSPVLCAPRLGCVNLHASLLPEYRGAAPIQRALMDGRKETGVCLMQMDVGMDTGDIWSRHCLGIGPEETHEQLACRLGQLAADVVRGELPRLVGGELTRTPQDDSAASYAPPISSVDTYLDFSRSAESLANHVRALSPRPGATSTLSRNGASLGRLRITAARAAPEPAGTERREPGRVRVDASRLYVATGTGELEVMEAQLEGRKVLAARDLLNGRALTDGDRLSPPLR